MPSSPSKQDRTGLVAALSAYLLWGFLPLYLLTVRSIPAIEFVAWRVLWTVPICLLIVVARRQWPELRAALRDRRLLGWLAMSALLIGTNWLVYVWAIQAGEVYAASLGYYINPLLNVVLGTLFLGERLNRTQWGAVALAGVGVAVLVAGALTSAWISLSLAVSFALYGLVRKQVAVGALPGLTVESVLLAPLAAVGAALYAATPAGSAMTQSPALAALVVLGGVLTAVPLLLFAIAARRMPLSTLGFIQYLAPSIVFILGLTVFEQPLAPAKLVSFLFIWAAVGIFVADTLRRSRAPRPA